MPLGEGPVCSCRDYLTSQVSTRQVTIGLRGQHQTSTHSLVTARNKREKEGFAVIDSFPNFIIFKFLYCHTQSIVVFLSSFYLFYLFSFLV